MTEPLGVTPQELRATSEHLADTSARMKQVLSTLQGKLGGEGAAWGDDEIGDKFANGGDGYLAQVDWVKGSIEAKTNLLDDYASSLRSAADTLEQQDQT